MSTLSLEDLGPKMRRELGLEAACACARCRSGPALRLLVVETVKSAPPEPAEGGLPGAAWLETGLHRLRVPMVQASSAASVDSP